MSKEPVMVRCPTGEWVLDHQMDLTGTLHPIEVVVDHARGVLHVNVEGVCLLRICRTTMVVEEKH